MVSLPEQAFQEALDTLLQYVQRPESADEAVLTPDDSNTMYTSDMEKIDKEVCTLLTVLNGFTNVVKRHIASLRQQHNQLVPFYRLPTEVLVVILELVAAGGANVPALPPSVSYTHHYQAIVPLANVASYWRTAINSAPQFWTKLETSWDPQFAEIILQRSKNGPLDIIYSMRPDKPQDDFLPVLLPHRARWRSFCNTASMVLSPWLMDGTMPLLERLELNHARPGEELPVTIRECAPKLYHLSITAFRFPLGSPALTRLESIRITPAIGGVLLSIPQWQDFLTSASQLKSIHASGKSITPGLPGQSYTFEVHMPKLDVLELYDLPYSLIGTLLCSIISAPHHYPRVEIESPIDDGGGLVTMFPCSTSDNCLLSKIREMTWIKGTSPSFYRKSVRTGIAEEDGLLKVDFDRDHAADLFRSLIPPTGISSLRFVSLSGSRFFRNGHFTSSIRFCPGLEHLSLIAIGAGQLDSAMNNLVQFCALMGTPLPSDSVASGMLWPCPKLRYLEVCSDNHFTSLLQLVKTRYGVTDEGSVSPSLPPPVFLQELRLRELPPLVNIRLQNPDLVNRLDDICRSHGTKLKLG